MQIEKQLPLLCHICNEVNVYKKQYNSLFQDYIYMSKCDNNHYQQYPIIYEEVCPLCKLNAITNCNCINTTKTCINNHSWMTCKKCRFITISKKKKHITFCNKCNPPKKSFCDFFLFFK